MAAAFTKENENFCRLVVLINEKGLDALRASLEFFSTQKYGVATFQQVLQLPSVQRRLTTLKGPGRGKPISPYQWNVLYPLAGWAVTVTDLDITLCFVLIRNITGLPQPLTSWDKPPAPGDNSLEGGLAQIKFLRNTLCHKDSPSVSDVDFDSYYNDIEKALLDISATGHWGITLADIQKFRNLPISKQQEQEVKDLVKEWYYQERDLFKVLGGIAEHTEETKKRTEDIQNFLMRDMKQKLDDIREHQVADQNRKLHHLPTYTLSWIETFWGRPLVKRRCLQHLNIYYKTMMGRIQRIPWEEDDTFDLEDMYVNLSQVIVDKRTGRTEIDIEHYTQMISEGKGVKIIIQGHSGIGKTTLVSKMVVDWSSGKWTMVSWWKSKFPLVLKLRDLTAEQSLADAVKIQLFNGVDISSQEIFEFLVIYKSQIILLLDGFDEFSVEGFSEIRGLIKREWFHDMSVILTTRPWRTKEVQDSWDKLIEIKGFKKKDVNVYIDNFFKTLPDGKTKSQKLKEEIEKEQYYPLFETPLVVLFNCLVFLDKEKIYSRLTDQYKAVIDCMKERASAKGYNFSDKDYQLIEDLALQGLLSGEKGLIFSTKELSQKLGEDIFHLGFFAVVKRPDRGIQNLEFVFTHKTLQEYQAACSLVRLWKEGNQTKLQEVESHCQNPKGILEMGKLLQFCCSIDIELKKEILPWFPRNLIANSRIHISSEDFMVIMLTKETSDLCQAYSSCVSDHSKATEEIVKAKNHFLPIAERYNYSILFHKNNGVVLGITSSDQHRLLEKTTEILTEKQAEYDVTETEQSFVFDCDFSSHLEYEISDVIHYLTFCKNLKLIRITGISSRAGQTFNHPLFLLNEATTPQVEIILTDVRIPYEELAKCLISISKLKRLDIRSSNIGDEEASVLGKKIKLIPYLEELRISNNEISLTGFSYLAILLHTVPTLKKLDFSGNKIEEERAKVLGENFKFIPNLEELFVSQNAISSTGCFYLATNLHSVPKLKKLDVGGNKIGENGAKVLGENFQFIPNLEELFVSQNAISSTGCFYLATNLHSVPKLKKLDVGGNKIGENGAKVLGENFKFIPNLEELFVSQNAISSTGCFYLATNLHSVPKLKKLDVGGNKIGENGAKVLGENFQFIPNLEELLFGLNDISSKGCFHLATHLQLVPKLKKLDVSENDILDQGAKWLGKNFRFIPNLEELIIWGNNISKTGCFHLAIQLHTVPKLKKLDVNRNNFGEDGAKVLGENIQFIPKLEELCVSQNAITSMGCFYLAKHLHTVPRLRKLDVSRNYFGEEEFKVLIKNFPFIPKLKPGDMGAKIYIKA